jgi:hypothetical protein
VSPPRRTEEQRKAALERAQDVRRLRSRLKAALKNGEILAVPVLREPPAYAKKMRAYEFVRSIRGLGNVKAGKMLRHCIIAPSKTLEGLSDRQRDALLEALEGRVNRSLPPTETPSKQGPTEREGFEPSKESLP